MATCANGCGRQRKQDSWLCGPCEISKATNATPEPKPKPQPKPVRADTLTFAKQCYYAHLPEPVPEYIFHEQRKWRFDFAWPDHRLSIEVEGGAFMKGGSRHTRGAGFRKDVEKYAEAVILGWRVLRVLPEHIENGQALTWAERALTDSNK